jgi:hypothetical protein
MILLIGRMIHWKRKPEYDEDKEYFCSWEKAIPMQYYISIQKKMKLSNTAKSIIITQKHCYILVIIRRLGKGTLKKRSN